MMKSGEILAVVAAGVFLASPAMSATGRAIVTGTAEGSSVTGTLTLTDSPKGLEVSGEVRGLTPGKHGFHIHEFGDCSDMAKAAGSHYNPADHPHGHAVKDGPKKSHPGDMGNLEADTQGNATVKVTLPQLSLSTGKMTAAGRAVIVHEKADDFGQPVGNAGGRIGCGVIVVTGN